MDVLTYIKKYIQDNNGRAPSYRQIGEACNIASTGGVKKAVDDLVTAGEIVRGEGGRNLRLAKCETETIKAGRFYIGICYTCRKTYVVDAASRMADWIKNHKESEQWMMKSKS